MAAGSAAAVDLLRRFRSAPAVRENSDQKRELNPIVMQELRSWIMGDMVDIETEDGWELGAIILGPASSGDPFHKRVRFADGVEDDWDVSFLRRAAGNETANQMVAVASAGYGGNVSGSSLPDLSPQTNLEKAHAAWRARGIHVNDCWLRWRLLTTRQRLAIYTVGFVMVTGLSILVGPALWSSPAPRWLSDAIMGPNTTQANLTAMDLLTG